MQIFSGEREIKAFDLISGEPSFYKHVFNVMLLIHRHMVYRRHVACCWYALISFHSWRTTIPSQSLPQPPTPWPSLNAVQSCPVSLLQICTFAHLLSANIPPLLCDLPYGSRVTSSICSSTSATASPFMPWIMSSFFIYTVLLLELSSL